MRDVVLVALDTREERVREVLGRGGVASRWRLDSDAALGGWRPWRRLARWRRGGRCRQSGTAHQAADSASGTSVHTEAAVCGSASSLNEAGEEVETHRGPYAATSARPMARVFLETAAMLTVNEVIVFSGKVTEVGPPVLLSLPKRAKESSENAIEPPVT